MTFLPERRSGKELLDIPSEQGNFPEFARSMAEIRAVNRFLGGKSSILMHLDELVGSGERGPLRVLDVATGSADIPVAIADWARQKGIEVKITAVDLNPNVIRVAAAHVEGYPEISLVRADGFELPFRPGTFDIVTCSLTLHHFTEEDTIKFLGHISGHAGRGWIIGDLRRSWIAYFLFYIITVFFLRNRYTRHDGLLSILKSYTPVELEALAKEGGLTGFKVVKLPFWRMVLVGGK
jgi:2-polyprenyl-3-methyl-5-hydroxy-6-metoxy-1,4-benzoquinol methylase